MKKNMLLLCAGLLVSTCNVVPGIKIDDVLGKNGKMAVGVLGGSGLIGLGYRMSNKNDVYTHKGKKPDGMMDAEKFAAIAGTLCAGEIIFDGKSEFFSNIAKLGIAGLGYLAYNSSILNNLCNSIGFGYIADPVDKHTGEVYKGAGSFLRGALIVGLGRDLVRNILESSASSLQIEHNKKIT